MVLQLEQDSTAGGTQGMDPALVQCCAVVRVVLGTGPPCLESLVLENLGEAWVQFLSALPASMAGSIHLLFSQQRHSQTRSAGWGRSH